jgi:hypothetical protein
MCRRVTKRRRWQAAWLLALIYVFAVLAPAAANAFAPAFAHAATAHDHLALGHDHDDAAPDRGHDHDGEHTDQLKCCGLACISALPAHHIDVARPELAPIITMVFVSQEGAGRSPPRLYRPPIS